MKHEGSIKGSEPAVDGIQIRRVDRRIAHTRIEHGTSQIQSLNCAIQLGESRRHTLPRQSRDPHEPVGMALNDFRQVIVDEASSLDTQVWRKRLGAGHVHAEHAHVDSMDVHVRQDSIDPVGFRVHQKVLNPAVGDQVHAAARDSSRLALVSREQFGVLAGKNMALTVDSHRRSNRIHFFMASRRT